MNLELTIILKVNMILLYLILLI